MLTEKEQCKAGRYLAHEHQTSFSSHCVQWTTASINKYKYNLSCVKNNESKSAMELFFSLSTGIHLQLFRHKHSLNDAYLNLSIIILRMNSEQLRCYVKYHIYKPQRRQEKPKLLVIKENDMVLVMKEIDLFTQSKLNECSEKRAPNNWGFIFIKQIKVIFIWICGLSSKDQSAWSIAIPS